MVGPVLADTPRLFDEKPPLRIPRRDPRPRIGCANFALGEPIVVVVVVLVLVLVVLVIIVERVGGGGVEGK